MIPGFSNCLAPHLNRAYTTGFDRISPLSFFATVWQPDAIVFSS
jgi:hypothetical protein